MIDRPIHDANDAGCLHRNTALVVVVFRNGTRHVCRQCFDCDGRSTWFSAAELERMGVRRDELDVCQDYRTDADYPAAPCDVCGSELGVEEHHWAPRSLGGWFRSHDSWPTAMLCRACHQEWHRAVTPDLVAQGITLIQLGARRSTTVRELMDTMRGQLVTARKDVA